MCRDNPRQFTPYTADSSFQNKKINMHGNQCARCVKPSDEWVMAIPPARMKENQILTTSRKGKDDVGDTLPDVNRIVHPPKPTIISVIVE